MQSAQRCNLDLPPAVIVLMITLKHPSSARALTRLELLLAVAVLGLTCLVWSPAFAITRQKTDHAVCINNLRLIGRACQIWGTDHSGHHPTRESITSGGVMHHSLQANAWFQFAALSNQLESPRVLACPADADRKPASNFGDSASGGLANSVYGNNAVSYWVSPHAGWNRPQSFLCGDRNLRIGSYGSCDLGLPRAAGILTSPAMTNTFWTNGIHGAWGQVLLFDGQVRTYTDPMPRVDLDRSQDPRYVIQHFIMP
jgi:hypothetical protein